MNVRIARAAKIFAPIERRAGQYEYAEQRACAHKRACARLRGPPHALRRDKPSAACPRKPCLVFILRRGRADAEPLALVLRAPRAQPAGPPHLQERDADHEPRERRRGRRRQRVHELPLPRRWLGVGGGQEVEERRGEDVRERGAREEERGEDRQRRVHAHEGRVPRRREKGRRG
jgi:hypothetical protein